MLKQFPSGRCRGDVVDFAWYRPALPACGKRRCGLSYRRRSQRRAATPDHIISTTPNGQAPWRTPYAADAKQATAKARTKNLRRSSNAGEAMAALAATRDGVLVSAETEKDFQLYPGDLIRLRLQSASDHQYHVVSFHYLGVAREFPTAPSDSFLVTNSGFIAEQTASASVETILVKTDKSPPLVAESVRQLLAPGSGATVRDISQAEKVVRSGLTAISLNGLTKIELSFAVVLAAAGAGFVLILGFEERRRTLAIAAAIGARPHQIGAFVWSEALLMLAGGGLAGALLGWLVAGMLVKLLTGVFDPPPEQLSVPWIYLVGVAGVPTATVLAADDAPRYPLDARNHLAVVV